MTNSFAIVARAAHWTDRDHDIAIATAKNAIRLLEDAALLQSYERYGTAYSLSTVAFEELGKIVLRYWSSDEVINEVGKGWSFHLKKQAAAGCLLLADVAKQHIDSHPARKGMGTFSHGSTEHEEELRHSLAEALQSSKVSRLMDHIAIHAIERTKQMGFYADEWLLDAGLKPGGMGSGECATALEEARTAIRLLRSIDHLHIAAAVYRIGPLANRLVEAGKRFSASGRRLV